METIILENTNGGRSKHKVEWPKGHRGRHVLIDVGARVSRYEYAKDADGKRVFRFTNSEQK